MKSGKEIKELSVFFPAYNEEKNIETTVLDARKVLEKLKLKKWEIIIVDDGSKDKTGKIADNLSKKYKGIRAVHNRPNQGYGGALKTGFKNSKYGWVAFADSDGQFDFGEISKFLKVQKDTDADLVLGIRAKRADPFMRKLYTFVWSHLLPKLLFGLKVTDYSCGFKLIKKEVYKSALPLVGEEKVTQIELLTKAQRKGYKFAEVKVNHYPRKAGKQTGANLNVILKSLEDLMKLRLLLK